MKNPITNEASAQSLVDKLIAEGINASLAKDFVRQQREEVERQLEALPFREQIKNRTAFLINAIRDHYPIPADLSEKKAAAERQRQAELAHAEMKVREEYKQRFTPAYFEYLGVAMRALAESESEAIAEFEQTFNGFRDVTSNLNSEDREAFRLSIFETFAGERPYLRICTFWEWDERLNQDRETSQGHEDSSGKESEDGQNRPLLDVEARGAEAANSGRPTEEIASAEAEEWEAPAPFHDFTLPDFPVAALPVWQRSFVESLAMSTQTPVDMAAMISLAVFSAAVARKVRIEARKGWEEPLNIFTAVALAPGNRKSQVMVDAKRPLDEFEQELTRRECVRIAVEASEYRILQNELVELERKCAKADSLSEQLLLKEKAKEKARELAARKLPVFPKMIVDDVTAEVLASILVEQQGRIALFSAEGGIFDTLAGRYTGTPNFDVLLKGHAGDDLRVDRRDRSEHVEKPALTVGLAIQPDVLRGLVEKPGFQGRGLIGRFLYSLPQSLLGRRTICPTPMPDETRATYRRNIFHLADIPPCTTDRGTEPRVLKFSTAADQCLATFEKEIEPMLGDDGQLASIRDWGGKLVGATVRLAGILHLAQYAEVIDREWVGEVSVETLTNAIQIARYLIPHACMAYSEMGADPKLEDAKIVLRWIKKADKATFTKREAFEGSKGRFKKVVDLDTPLKLLEDHGYIRSEERLPEKRPGRRPSIRFLVNPLWISLHTG